MVVLSDGKAEHYEDTCAFWDIAAFDGAGRCYISEPCFFGRGAGYAALHYGVLALLEGSLTVR
jgi:hypothetical protein